MMVVAIIIFAVTRIFLSMEMQKKGNVELNINGKC